MMAAETLKLTPRLRGLMAGIVNVEPRYDRVLGGVVADSRLVAPGDLFLARRGASSDARDYVQTAIARGARAVVFEAPSIMITGASTITATAQATPYAARLWLGSGSRAMRAARNGPSNAIISQVEASGNQNRRMSRWRTGVVTVIAGEDAFVFEDRGSGTLPPEVLGQEGEHATLRVFLSCAVPGCRASEPRRLLGDPGDQVTRLVVGDVLIGVAEIVGLQTGEDLFGHVLRGPKGVRFARKQEHRPLDLLDRNHLSEHRGV